MEKNIHFYPFRRRISLHVNLIAAYIQNGKVEEGNNAADKYFQIKCHSDFERQAHFGEGCGSIIPYLVSAGQYDKAIEMAEEIKDFLENDGGFLDSLRQLNIYMAYISMYVVLGEYEKAIEWQALQLNVPWAPGIDDMRLTCYLFHLIAHYELGNFALIESLCRSAQRKLGDKSFPTQTERIVTRFIQKVPSPSEEQQHWQDFKAALQEVKMNSGEDRKYHFLDFELWVESKIQGQPLIELVNAQSV